MNPETLGVINSTLSAIRYGVLNIHCFLGDVYQISGRYFNLGNNQCSYSETIVASEFLEKALPAPGEYTISNISKKENAFKNGINIDRVVTLNSGEYKNVDARLSTNCWEGVRAIIDNHFEKKLPIGKIDVFPKVVIPADTVSYNTTGFATETVFDVRVYTIDNVPHYPHSVVFGFAQLIPGVKTIKASSGNDKKPKGSTGVIFDPINTSIVGWMYKEADKYDGSSKDPTKYIKMPWTGDNPEPVKNHDRLTPFTYLYHNLPDDLKAIITPRITTTTPGKRMEVPYISVQWGAKSMIEKIDDASTNLYTSGKCNVIEQAEDQRFGLPLWMPRTYEIGRYRNTASIREYMDSRPFQYFEQDYSRSNDYTVMTNRGGSPMCWWTGSPSMSNSNGFAYVPESGLNTKWKGPGDGVAAIPVNQTTEIKFQAYGYLPMFLVAATDSEFS